MTHRHPLAFLLGLEGVALLRAWAGDYPDACFTDDRLAEMRALLSADISELGDPVDVGRVDVVSGYRSWAATYDEPGNPLIAVEQPIVHEILTGLPVGAALDAACGTGRHSRHLAALGHSVTGIDLSPDMLGRARENVPSGRFVLGDVTAVPLPDATVDTVVCGLALAHVDDLRSTLSELVRVLKPGGHLVLSDIHVMSLYLNGIAGGVDEEGRQVLMPAFRRMPSDYLAAALPLGLRVRALHEPRWGHSDDAGGPVIQRWGPEAAVAAYQDTPAAIIWHFEKPG